MHNIVIYLCITTSECTMKLSLIRIFNNPSHDKNITLELYNFKVLFSTNNFRGIQIGIIPQLKRMYWRICFL